MKILRLDLDAYGPFTGKTLDLSGGDHGLHLVCGLNEAGKTSALRALRHLLYGIPHRTADDFVHDYKKLRLGAAIEHSDGSLLEFVRFKRAKNPLCEADGATPLDPARLERFLGGVDETLFSTMFGIDHEALVEGGREILRGGGRLGEMLFSASSGIAGLREIQGSLVADADAYFLTSGRGRKQRIPEAVARVREAQERIAQLQVTTEEWTRHDQALRSAEAESTRLETLLREAQRESNRLKRIRDALPLLSERAQLAAERDAHRDVIVLAADFADRRREAQGRLGAALQQAGRSRDRIANLREQMGQIEVAETVLDAGDAIEALHEQRGESRKAHDDRPRVASFLQDHEHAARDILQGLGRPRELAEAETFRLRADEPILIQQLAREAEKLDTRRDATREAILRHREEAAQVERQLGELPATADLEPLRAALRRATRLGDLEARRDEAMARLATVEEAVSTALRQLPGWSGPAEDLECLHAPLPETIARFEASLQDAEARCRERHAERSREERSAADLEARLRHETSQRDLPTEDDLRRSRQRRDEGWRLVRRSWLDGDADPDEVASCIADLAPDRTLADAYEQGVARGDDLADRLRREAGDVAQRAERLTALEGYRARIARIVHEEQEARADLDRATQEWGRQVASLGLSGLTPQELKAWLDQREKALALVGQGRAGRAEVERLSRQADEQRERLSSCLTDLDAPAAGPEEGLSALIDRAQGFVEHNKALAHQRETLGASLARERSELARAEAKLAEIEAARGDWRGAWGKCMARIGLDDDTTPEQANVFVEEIRKLHKHLDDARGFRSRLKGIDRDGERFAADVAEVARRVAPDLTDTAPAEAVEQLYARLRAARRDDQARRSLREQVEAEEASRSDAERSIAEARLALDALCRDAGCNDPDDLPAAEQRSAHRLRTEAELRRCEGQVLNLSAGATVEAFLDEVGELDPDGLEGTIRQRDREMAELQQQINEVNQAIGAERGALAAIDGRSQAAAANDQAGHALAQLQGDVPRYAALRLAAHVLQQGIERYRQRNQAPVLRRASELFARLTAGSFAGLTIAEDDRGEGVLVGVRPDGQATLGVDCMSDGSCDQLYLALRVASLEMWLRAHEPIPLVVDDILLRFDDPRSIAALHVLAELSRLTQVIFFTHHTHLLDLARTNLPGDVLFTHEMSAEPRAIASTNGPPA